MKKKGEKASYAQSNTSGKVMGELYKRATGVQAVEVPYRTANDSLNDFASGRLDYGMMDPVFALSQARAGRLRMLAVSTAQRMQAVPELPTMTEAGVPGVELLTWFAAMVPSATPRPIVDKLNKWFNEVLATEETKKFLNSFGGDPFITTPDEGAGAVPARRQGLGGIRQGGQDRAAVTAPAPADNRGLRRSNEDLTASGLLLPFGFPAVRRDCRCAPSGRSGRAP